MKIQPYVEQLEQSEEYKNFKVKYPDSFMVAGFFILDLEQSNNTHQIDFYLPKENKIAAFTLDEGITLKIIEKLGDKTPEKMDLSTNIDLDALQGILADEMHNRGMSEKIKKIIAVIQNEKGKKIWYLNCVLSGMEILNSHIEDESKSVLKIDKSSMLDLIQKLPAKKMKAPETKEDLNKEIKKLDSLGAQIEKEKEKLKKELAGKES